MSPALAPRKQQWPGKARTQGSLSGHTTVSSRLELPRQSQETELPSYRHRDQGVRGPGCPVPICPAASLSLPPVCVACENIFSQLAARLISSIKHDTPRSACHYSHFTGMKIKSQRDEMAFPTSYSKCQSLGLNHSLREETVPEKGKSVSPHTHGHRQTDISMNIALSGTPLTPDAF